MPSASLPSRPEGHAIFSAPWKLANNSAPYGKYENSGTAMGAGRRIGQWRIMLNEAASRR